MLYSENKLRDFIDRAPILPPGSVVRTGKDVRGFYPGQVGRVHKEYLTRGSDLCFLPRPFSKLQPAPVIYEAETLFQPDFDNSALRNYVYFQQMKKPAIDWYSQTSYRAAFDFIKKVMLRYLNVHYCKVKMTRQMSCNTQTNKKWCKILSLCK
uniref:Chromosome 1 open reading frame 100 n=1 Tax=Calidris pygmaea TaxID=425635 RepID=A0A8C3JKP0_9CHAR